MALDSKYCAIFRSFAAACAAILLIASTRSGRRLVRSVAVGGGAVGVAGAIAGVSPSAVLNNPPTLFPLGSLPAIGWIGGMSGSRGWSKLFHTGWLRVTLGADGLPTGGATLPGTRPLGYLDPNPTVGSNWRCLIHPLGPTSLLPHHRPGRLNLCRSYFLAVACPATSPRRSANHQRPTSRATSRYGRALTSRGCLTCRRSSRSLVSCRVGRVWVGCLRPLKETHLLLHLPLPLRHHPLPPTSPTCGRIEWRRLTRSRRRRRRRI